MENTFWLSVLVPIGRHGAHAVNILRLSAPGLSIEWVRANADSVAVGRHPTYDGLMIHETDPAY